MHVQQGHSWQAGLRLQLLVGAWGLRQAVLCEGSRDACAVLHKALRYAQGHRHLPPMSHSMAQPCSPAGAGVMTGQGVQAGRHVAQRNPGWLLQTAGSELMGIHMHASLMSNRGG